MRPTPVYFFFLLLLCGMAGLYGQDLENVEKSGERNLSRMTGTSEMLAPSVGLRAGKVKTLSDSLGKLPAQTEVQIRAKIDSLQSRPDSLPLDLARGKQAKAAGRVEKAEEAAGKITRKIDSLQRLLKNLQGFENLGGLCDGGKPGFGKVKVPALPNDDLSKVLELKKIPGYNSGGFPLKRDRLATSAGTIALFFYVSEIKIHSPRAPSCQ